MKCREPGDGREARGEKRSARERGKKAVVLRSVRMSAFPSSREGACWLSLSVIPLVYAPLGERGKGHCLGVMKKVGGGVAGCHTAVFIISRTFFVFTSPSWSLFRFPLLHLSPTAVIPRCRSPPSSPRVGCSVRPLGLTCSVSPVSKPGSLHRTSLQKTECYRRHEGGYLGSHTRTVAGSVSLLMVLDHHPYIQSQCCHPHTHDG